MSNRKIGFFDSGLGGISVLHAARELLPDEDFLYYGDNGNAPYGPKPLEEIRRLSRNAVNYLLARDVKAIVIACNTATSAFAEIIRSELSMPIIGMEPALKPAQENRRDGEILVLATKATPSLPKIERLKSTYGENALTVVGEGFVELVETGKAGTAEADAHVRQVLAPYTTRPIESVVLGCTHFPFLQSSIRKVFPEAVIHDGRFGTVRQLKRMLEMNDLLKRTSGGSIEYATSGDENDILRMQRLMKVLDR
ncbi:MAG: glutamate racemase [Clostridia bacterium]|nr:glutamate racemase [Clostridia bacterium]